MVYKHEVHHHRLQDTDYRRHKRYRRKEHHHKKSPRKKKKSEKNGPMQVRLRRANVVLGLITILGNAFILGAPYWRTTTNWFGVGQVTGYWMFEGLFLICLRQGYQALSQCYNLYPIMGILDGEVGVRSGKDFNIYPYLTSFRALMVIALLFSVAGLVCSALGLRCATIIEENSKQKRWVLIFGGVSHILSGSITGICVSWYASEVVYEFYSPYYQSAKMKFTLGACLYLGWICMVISLVCGSLMSCCTCCRKEKDEYEIDPEKVRQLMNQPAKTIDYMDSRSSIDGSFYRTSRRNSKFPDSDIEALEKRQDSKHQADDIPRRARRNSRYHEAESEKHSSNRRISKQHDPVYYTGASRRVSKVHDSDYYPHSASRRTSRVDNSDFRESANRRNSRKISILAEDVAQLLLSAGINDYSPKSERKSSTIVENKDGFI